MGVPATRALALRHDVPPHWLPVSAPTRTSPRLHSVSTANSTFIRRYDKYWMWSSVPCDAPAGEGWAAATPSRAFTTLGHRDAVLAALAEMRAEATAQAAAANGAEAGSPAASGGAEEAAPKREAARKHSFLVDQASRLAARWGVWVGFGICFTKFLSIISPVGPWAHNMGRGAKGGWSR